MKIVVNNIVTKVISGGQDDLHNPGVFEELRDYLSVDVPGAFFTSQYKRKVWDGKRYFLTPGGKMATGFLPLLLNHLDRDYPDLYVELIDDRGPIPEFKEQFIATIGSIEVNDEYEHQRRSIQAMNSIIDFRGLTIPFPRGILNAATNAGKTAVMAGVQLNLVGNPSMLILIHRTTIFDQLVEAFEDVYGEVGIITAKKYDPKNITIGMIKTVCNRLQKSVNVKKDLLQFRVVAVDEAHLAGSKTYIKVLQNVPAPVRVFVSGTPFDSDAIINKMMAVGMSGRELIHVSKRELMDKGISLECKVHIHLCNEPRPGVLIGYHSHVKAMIHNSVKRAAIIDGILRNYEGSTLIAVKEIEHGQLLSASLQLMGNKSITFVHGTDPERVQKIEDFKTGKIRTLISTTILKEGVNIPIISNVINAVGGKSKVDIKQWMGRGERTHGDLKEFTMHDFYDIGRHVESHSKVRISTYRKENLDVTLHYTKEDIKKIKGMHLQG